MLALTVVSFALAQSADGFSVPELDAQTWRMPIDASRTMWTDDSAAAPHLYAQGRVAGGWVDRPLVFLWEDGERVSLVTSAAHVNAIGALQVKRVRIGVDAPMYLYARGDLDRGGGLGDVAVDAKGTVLDRDGDRFGLAVGARVALPTATVDVPLALGGPAAEIRVIADREIGPVLLAANLGHRVGPRAELVNVDLDDEAFARIGAGWSPDGSWGLSGDVSVETTYASFLAGPATPVEAMFGAWRRVTSEVTLRGGASAGLSRGIGAPVARTVLAVSWEPPTTRDADVDGIVDRLDACPENTEDMDSWQDEDGCPEPTEVTVRAVDAAGQPVPGVLSRVFAADLDLTGASELKLAVQAGPYAFTGRAEGWHPLDAELTVPDGPPVVFDFAMTPLPPPGRVVLSVTDPQGMALPARWRVGSGDFATLTGTAERALEAGSYDIRIEADGYLSQLALVDLEAGETEQLAIVMKPAKVVVTREKLDIRDKIYFETNKAVIKPESYPLLDEVAAILLDRPDILALRIEGHTDSRGKDAYNLVLSDKRAAAVLQYLASKGVDPARLVSQGFGETRPLDPREAPEAWDKNRRVDFYISVWADQAQPKEAP
jgi:outer membrane protein OmpA-like peptidoglycan-associated protein